MKAYHCSPVRITSNFIVPGAGINPWSCSQNYTFYWKEREKVDESVMAMSAMKWAIGDKTEIFIYECEVPKLHIDIDPIFFWTRNIGPMYDGFEIPKIFKYIAYTSMIIAIPLNLFKIIFNRKYIPWRYKGPGKIVRIFDSSWNILEERR